MLKESRKLRRSLIIAALAVSAALLSITAATFAWYVYNTSAHTTEVKMSAGSSVSLQISNEREGPYSSVTRLEKFSGSLIPVSTNEIAAGFQKVAGFEGMWDTQTGTYRSVAKYFRPSVDAVDYYKTSLYLRTNATNLDIYLSDIGSRDDDTENPISTAMRLGLVVEGREYIFAVNTDTNPNADDNGAKEPQGGYVLDSRRTDGTTVPFAPLTSENFCNYDSASGAVSLTPNSRKLCTISGDGSAYGEPVKVDVYLWLEGCDEDCTLNLAGQTMELLAISFAGFAGEGGTANG